MPDVETTSICPKCFGCGHTSVDPITGKDVPQPEWTDNNTTAQGWTVCDRCQGVGVVPVAYRWSGA